MTRHRDPGPATAPKSVSKNSSTRSTPEKGAPKTHSKRRNGPAEDGPSTKARPSGRADRTEHARAAKRTRPGKTAPVSKARASAPSDGKASPTTRSGARKARAAATYVYCVGRGEPPSVRGAPRGVPHTRRLRTLPAGDGLWIAAADAPLDHFAVERIEAGLSDVRWVAARAQAHEDVVEHFARRATVVPMTLFTLFSDEERATRNMQRMRASLGRVLDRIDGCEEWGVRVRLDPARAARTARRRAQSTATDASSGTGFLLRKKKERDALGEASRRARDAVEAAFEQLRAQAVDARLRAAGQAEIAARLLLDAAFLVPRADAAAFEALVKEEAARLGEDGCVLTLSGPWPAYNFVGDANGGRR